MSANAFKIDDSNFPNTVTKLTVSENEIVYIVGTAHFSEESNADVTRVIESTQPDGLVLELCNSRSTILHLDESEIRRRLDTCVFRDLVKTYGLSGSITHYLMLRMSLQITQLMGFPPGGEFRAGFQAAIKTGCCSIYLGDRPISITWQRTMSRMSAWGKLKMAVSLLGGVGNITKEDVERMKQSDLLTELLSQLAEHYPEMAEVILYERDQYLCRSIWNALEDCAHQRHKQTLQQSATAARAVSDRHRRDRNLSGDASSADESCSNDEDSPGTNDDFKPLRSRGPNDPVIVVAVVGIGHVSGIVNNWPNASKISHKELSIIPAKSKYNNVISLMTRVAMFGSVGYVAYYLVKKMYLRIFL